MLILSTLCLFNQNKLILKMVQTLVYAEEVYGLLQEEEKKLDPSTLKFRALKGAKF